MKCSKIRTALLTFVLGLLSVPFFTGLYDKWSEPYVELPEVISESPIIAILPTKQKPFDLTTGSDSGRDEPTELHPFNINGGGGSGGQTCEDFIKSLGKLTKQSRHILALTPCHDSNPR